jgi:hypothetical protein
LKKQKEEGKYFSPVKPTDSTTVLCEGDMDFLNGKSIDIQGILKSG